VSTLEITLTILMAILLVGVAVFFIWRQGSTLQTLRTDGKIPLDQRRYLYKQCMRRFFGSFVLILLGFMLSGSLFLDYELVGTPFDELGPLEKEAAKQSFQFLSIYWMTFLLILMAVMALAIFDFVATARHGVQLQKQLLREHQEILEAELEEHRHRRAEMN
jgi:hypothetical protein